MLSSASTCHDPVSVHRRRRRRGCRGRDPQYFDKCFIFSPSAELLNTASRCHFHHTILRSKIHNFLGRGAIPLLVAYGASILASSALDLRPPNIPVALTATPMCLCLSVASWSSIETAKRIDLVLARSLLSTSRSLSYKEI